MNFSEARPYLNTLIAMAREGSRGLKSGHAEQVRLDIAISQHVAASA